MEWPSFLWAYLGKLLGYWWALVPGVFFVVVDLYAKIRQLEFKLSRAAYLRVFVAGLLLAQMLAYKDIWVQTAGLGGQILNLGIVRKVDIPGHPVFAVVELGLVNTGNPTSIIGWRFRVIVGGKTYPSYGFYNPTYIPSEGFAFANDPKKDKPIVVKPSDSIRTKPKRL